MLLVLLFPGAVFLLVFTALPIIMMVAESFYKSDYIVREFVGLKNYIKTFQDPEYWSSFSASFLYSVLICPVVTLVPLLVALMVYDLPKRIRTYTRFVFFVPSFSAGVIISQVWRWIFQPRMGILNHLLGLVGIAPVMWMGTRVSAITGISLMMVMGGMGLPLLIYLSRILAIDEELYETAVMDGASKFQIRMRVVLPELIPTILLVVLMTMFSGFYILETIIMMTGGGYGSRNFIFDIYHQGIYKNALGVASARSVLLFVLVFALTFLKRRAEWRLREE